MGEFHRKPIEEISPSDEIPSPGQGEMKCLLIIFYRTCEASVSNVSWYCRPQQNFSTDGTIGRR